MKYSISVAPCLHLLQQEAEDPEENRGLHPADVFSCSVCCFMRGLLFPVRVEAGPNASTETQQLFLHAIEYLFCIRHLLKGLKSLQTADIILRVSVRSGTDTILQLLRFFQSMSLDISSACLKTLSDGWRPIQGGPFRCCWNRLRQTV